MLAPLAESICEGDMGVLAEKINGFFQSFAAHLPPTHWKLAVPDPGEPCVDQITISVNEVDNNVHISTPRRER